MEYLKEYNIENIKLDELNDYTKVLSTCFRENNYYEEYLDNMKRNFDKGYIFLGAKLFNDVIIGGICLEKKPIYRNEIYIDSLFVDSKFRKLGIASNLLNYILENKLNLFNLDEINLYLFCVEYMRQFYKNRGFDVTDKFNSNKSKIKFLRMDRKI